MTQAGPPAAGVQSGDPELGAERRAGRKVTKDMINEKVLGEPTGDCGTQRDNQRGGRHCRGTEKAGKETRSEDGLATTSRALMLALGVSGGGRERKGPGTYGKR